VTRSLRAAGYVGLRPRGTMLLGERARGVETPTGDGAFDGVFLVFSEDANPNSMLTPEIRAALVRFAERARDASVYIAEGNVSLRWFGYERDAGVLDEARELVSSIPGR